MRSRAGLRSRWKTLVFGDRDISDGCRVLLLFLAEHMTDAGRVSVPRETIAEALYVSDRRVTARIKEAVDAGLLSKCGGGFKGTTAQYEALVKVDSCRPPLSAIGGGPASTYGVHLCDTKSDPKVDTRRPPNARASVNKTRRRHENERHDGRHGFSAVPQLRSDEDVSGHLLAVAASPYAAERVATMRAAS